MSKTTRRDFTKGAVGSVVGIGLGSTVTQEAIASQPEFQKIEVSEEVLKQLSNTTAWVRFTTPTMESPLCKATYFSGYANFCELHVYCPLRSKEVFDNLLATPPEQRQLVAMRGVGYKENEIAIVSEHVGFDITHFGVDLNSLSKNEDVTVSMKMTIVPRFHDNAGRGSETI